MNRAATALQFISPIERSVWVTMGMALSSEFGDAARDVWMDWSRQADSFKELYNAYPVRFRRWWAPDKGAFLQGSA